MKTFEIPACGGFMLTNRTDEQLEFFAEDEGAAYYSTAAELLAAFEIASGSQQHVPSQSRPAAPAALRL